MHNYSLTRDASVRVTRLVLGEMAVHDAQFDPLTFEVFFEHMAGINARLSAAIAALQLQHPKLTDADIAKLHRDFIAPPDSGAMERVKDELGRVLGAIEESAQKTGNAASDFSQQLISLTDSLSENEPNSSTILDAISGAATMQQSIGELQAQVQTSQREIEQLREDLRRTREDVVTDALTKILNRRGFNNKVDALVKAPAAPGRNHLLVLFDIDHFKQVNDTYGHVVGDRVLAGVAEVLRTVTAAAHLTAARYGGEEFAILLENTTCEEARRLAEGVLARVKSMTLRDRSKNAVIRTITISAGVAALGDDDAQRWTTRADQALYRSKTDGRDRVSFDEAIALAA
ncbi:GGDEF domain-containing protein [soil metagenome]